MFGKESARVGHHARLHGIRPFQVKPCFIPPWLQQIDIYTYLIETHGSPPFLQQAQ